MSMTSECRIALRNLRQGGWLLAVVVVMLAVAIGGQTAPPTGARGSEEQSCVVIQELAAQRPLITRGRGCATRLSPASTFKVPHALVALETGVVTTESLERWDGRKYRAPARLESGSHGHHGAAAVGPVAVSTRRAAHRRGANVRMARARSSTATATSPVPSPSTGSNGTLQIAVPEQVAFLHRFYRRPAASRAALLARGSRRSPAGGRDGRELARRPSTAWRLAACGTEREDRSHDHQSIWRQLVGGVASFRPARLCVRQRGVA